jgi:hypothetical protein
MGSGCIDPHFLDFGTSWSEWSTSRFTPGERAPSTHWIGGWVDLRAGLDCLEKRKFLTLTKEHNVLESESVSVLRQEVGDTYLVGSIRN